jgi:phosphatidylglycerophosphatase A
MLASMISQIPIIIASCFGVGYLPKAPGTLGSIVGLIVGLIVVYFLSFKALGVTTMLLFFVGWWASHQVVKTSGDDLDPSWVVIDEVVGMMLVGCVLSYYHLTDWLEYTLAFGLFRFFDIFKFGPVKWADQKLCAHKSTAGLGIMLDDVLAALFAILFISTYLLINQIG